MPFYMNETRELVVKSAREFTDKEIRPVAEQIDRDDVFPMRLFKQAGELDYLGIIIPEDEGGTGMDLVTYCLIIEETSKSLPTLAECMIDNTALTLHQLEFLDDDMQKKWLVPAAKGELICVTCMTEPIWVTAPQIPGQPKVSGSKKPAANHPWRRSPIGRARHLPSKPANN